MTMKRFGWALSVFLLGFGVVTSARAQAQEACPGKPSAHVISRTDAVQADGTIKRTTRCDCNDGYENAGGACVRITTIGPRRPTIMREQTKAECVRAAGVKLQEDLDKCQSPVVECLTSAGVRPKEAICAGSALVVALDPTKITVLGAVLACGDKLYEAADICAPTWGQCQTGPLASHRTAVEECAK